MQAETREEKLLKAISDGEKSGIVPYTRQEKFLSYIAGETDEKPTPITRIEMFLDKIERGGGGGDGTAVIRPLTVTENGTYIPPAGTDGYAPINVNIPEKTPILEQKHIIKNGFHAPSEGYDGIGIAWVEVEPITESIAVTENGTYTPAEGVDGFSSVKVEVPTPEPVTEELTVTENGTYTPAEGVDGFSEVKVEVQASGGGSDTLKQIVEGTITEITAEDLADTTKIGGYAFYKRNSLVSVEIPASVTEILLGCFESCANLEKVYFRNVAGIKAFTNTSFKDCKGLSEVHIDDLSAWCGKDFGSTYWNNPLYGGASLYVNDDIVENLVIPYDVTTIGEYSFWGCGSLKNVVMHNDVLAMSRGAFSWCKNLTSVKLSTAMTMISAQAFNSCSNLTSIDIPNNITEIQGGAFADTGLLDITIPDSVTKMGSDMFSFCTGMEKATIGAGITTVPSGLFRRCTNLKEIVLHSNAITTIYTQAFYQCKNLTKITIKSTTPPTLVSDALSDVPTDCAIYVPAESVDAYKAATNWSARADHIFAIEEGA